MLASNFTRKNCTEREVGRRRQGENACVFLLRRNHGRDVS